MQSIFNFLYKPATSLLILLLTSLAIGATYFIDNDRLAYHIDEYIFIRKTEFFELFFTQRNTLDPLWLELDASQPKIGPYLFGATLYLHGYTNLKQTFQQVNLSWENLDKVFATSNYTNIPNYNQAHQLIQISRQTSIIFSMLTFVGLILFLYHHRVNPFIILINLIFLSQNFVLLQVGRRALTDSMQLCALIFGLFFLSKLLPTLTKKISRSTIWYSLAVGLVCTFGAGVKSSGILTYFFVITIFILLAFYQKISLKTLALSFSLITLTFFTALVILHPYTYHQTPRHVFDMFYVRLAGSYDLQANYPTTAVDTRLDAAWRIIKNTLLPFGTFNNIRGIPGLDLILFTTGLFYLIKKNISNFKKRLVTFETLLILFFLLTFTSLTFYLRNDWSRYYLPTILAISLIQTYAIGQLIIKWSSMLDQENR